MFIIDYLPLLAGIGLFLFGMSMLGAALERLAGAGMENILHKLTSNRIKGVALGTGVTGIIQSSSATIVMVIGLLNAGIISLVQALPVIMGANIGSTVTAQILRLGDLGEASVVLKLLKPSSFGPMLIAAGAIIFMVAKKNNTKNWGSICMGLGMIFFGMNTMEKTMLPLSEQAWFTDLFQWLQNPFLGILLGLAMTVVLQSSSASVGILQAMSATGAITFSAAMPIILGQNLGKCVTVVIASIGSKKPAKRAVLLDVLINFSGLVFFAAVLYSVQGIFHLPFWDSVMTRGSIADFHTVFNIVTTLILLPFSNKLCSLATKLIKDKPSPKDEQMALLDDLLVKTPSIALQQARKLVVSMGETSLESYRIARGLHINYSSDNLRRLTELEEFLDRSERELNKYILKITPNDLSAAESRMATDLLHTLGDFERIGDHAVNISEVATYNRENKIHFSPLGEQELNVMFNAIDEILEKTVSIYKNEQYGDVGTIDPLESVADHLQITLRDRHVERLQHGDCSVESGISYIELITDLERIADHCSNVGNNMLQSKSEEYLHQHNLTFQEQKDRLADDYIRVAEKYQLPEQVFSNSNASK
ncbi:MAG: Na/Pi cotransporter family protein [Oscillospiraceae bacterium]|nr:Na/Pi cotransporter family protein [Oscillospiraceae bacterium]